MNFFSPGEVMFPHSVHSPLHLCEPMQSLQGNENPILNSADGAVVIHGAMKWEMSFRALQHCHLETDKTF